MDGHLGFIGEEPMKDVADVSIWLKYWGKVGVIKGEDKRIRLGFHCFK